MPVHVISRNPTINIYCDESCHLENDGASSMVLGCIWCPTGNVRRLSEAIRGIKAYHGLSRQEDYGDSKNPFEIKWTKVSASKSDFYCDLIDYFFDESDLHFRGILIRNKSVLDHGSFSQSHDDWYYKMMFLMLDRIINPNCKYRIYLDIKDTKSEIKRANLERYLRSRSRDSDGSVIERLQQIRSHESEILQLADLLIGAIAYKNRQQNNDFGISPPNPGKLKVIQRIQRRSAKSLSETTWQGERKFNLLSWESSQGGGL